MSSFWQFRLLLLNCLLLMEISKLHFKLTFQFRPHLGIIHIVLLQFVVDILDGYINRPGIQEVDIPANELHHNAGHIGVSANGIPKSTVDDTPEVIAKVNLEPPGWSEYMTVLSFSIEDHEADVFLIHSIEYLIKVVAELLPGNPLHYFQRLDFPEFMHIAFSILF